ncbi:DedA family protein [Streptomyces sp. T12]|uniref:DedA family protein n=1 Tax=Streptomyces sp. T12 TaxID=477697 RepID=UPI0021BD9D3C|nr:DedA family protein [Streptomyces sp. T12]
MVFAVTVGETSAFLGLLVPGETVILIAAALAGKGDLNPVILAVAVVTGGIVGDNLGYLMGRRCGRRPSSGRFRRFRPDAHLRRAQDFLVRHGGKAVFTGRFIGFVRTFLPFAAGAAAMPYRRFLFFSTLASVVWGIGNVVLGYFAGTAATEFLHSGGAVGALALAAVVLAVFVGLRLLKRRRHTGSSGSSIVVSHGSPQASGHDRVPLGGDSAEDRIVSDSVS